MTSFVADRGVVDRELTECRVNLGGGLAVGYWEQIELQAGHEGDAWPPGDREPFDAREICGWEDGDWPTWPALEMLSWIPDPIRREFVDQVTSVLSGDFAFVSPDRVDDLSAALTRLGFEVVRDDNLVSYISSLGPVDSHWTYEEPEGV